MTFLMHGRLRARRSLFNHYLITEVYQVSAKEDVYPQQSKHWERDEVKKENTVISEPFKKI